MFKNFLRKQIFTMKSISIHCFKAYVTSHANTPPKHIKPSTQISVPQIKFKLFENFQQFAFTFADKTFFFPYAIKNIGKF